MKLDGNQFVAAFEALKLRTDDDPAILLDRWKGSPELGTLCDDLAGRVREFEKIEESSLHPMTANVSPAAVQARRDFDNRWIANVRYVAGREYHDLLESLFGEEGPISDHEGDALAIQIQSWKSLAKEEANKIAELPWFAKQQRENDDSDNFEYLDDSLAAWSRFERIGLDLTGVFWRRMAVPHVLVPTHVATHYGQQNASLYRRYVQASQAFIFGAPLAALALQRATLEQALKKHWGAEGGSIRNARLPELSWDARASRLKTLANDALHNDPERESPEKLDRAIIENFHLLRLIIENAPTAKVQA